MTLASSGVDIVAVLLQTYNTGGTEPSNQQRTQGSSNGTSPVDDGSHRCLGILIILQRWMRSLQDKGHMWYREKDLADGCPTRSLETAVVMMAYGPLMNIPDTIKRTGEWYKLDTAPAGKPRATHLCKLRCEHHQ